MTSNINMNTVNDFNTLSFDRMDDLKSKHGHVEWIYL